MTDLPEAQLFINNEFVPSSTKETFDLYSPYSGEVVAKVHEASLDDVNTAVSAAEAAFPAWSSLSAPARGIPFKKLAEKLTSNVRELASLDAISMGRPVATNHDAGASKFSYYAEALYARGNTSLNTAGFLNMSLRQPFGVVGFIVPWNVPLAMFNKVAPALAAGNCVVLKTSEKAPLSIWKVCQWIAECGFPPGVINVLHGHGQKSGAAMASHMRIRCLSFTGSTRTGRVIQVAAAQSNLKKVVFELGGKGPALIFDDADIEEAVKGTNFGIFFNSGQICMANSRIYVQEGVAEKFVQAFKDMAAMRKTGDPMDGNVGHGPQADKIQYETVMKYIELGKQSGKDVIDFNNTDGAATEKEKSKDLAVQPVIFLDQPEDSRIMKEEIFGPVLVINTFKTEAEVIAKANDTEFGLFACVWTKDLERAIRVSKKLESGMVGVNCASPTHTNDLPFGGWKGSGVGREGYFESLEEFTEVKSIFIKCRGIGGIV